MSLKSIWKNVTQFTDKNSPTILAGCAVAGVIATGYMAYKSSPKAHEILQRYHEDKELIDPDDKETKRAVLKETAKDLAPVLLPPILMGSATVACIIGSNRIGSRRLAVLSAAYSIADSKIKDYQHAVLELGDQKAIKIKEAIGKRHAEKLEKNNDISDTQYIVTGDGEVDCVDFYSKQQFKSSVDKINQVINDLSADLINLRDCGDEDFIDLSDLYFRLGIDRTPYSDVFGWRYSDMVQGRLPIHLTSTIIKGRPFVVVDYDGDLSIRSEYLYRNADVL